VNSNSKTHPHKSVTFLRSIKGIIVRLRSLKRYKGDPEKPSIMHLAVTDKCNMSCAFCLYKNDNKNYKVLDVSKACSMIKEIDSPVILLSGGEPLLFGDILETTRKIVHFCRESGKITGVLTNGITLQKVLKSNYHEFRPGSRFFFQISIDGLKENHDRLRGNFDLITKNMRSAKSAGHLVYTNTVVSRNNVDTIPETINFISGLSDRIYLNPILHNGVKLDDGGLKYLGDYIINHQEFRVGNSVNFGKFLKGERRLKCMFHSLISVTPSGKIKFPCYCYGEGAEYVDSFREFIKKVHEHKIIFEERSDPQCGNCYTHCLHEADVYANFYWNEILEQIKRPGCLYKKYVAPLLKIAP
jgi:sulfatase maturation enzyme AslB (radical SAM superfamily)